MNVYANRASLNVDVDRKQAVLGVGTTGYQSDVVFPRGNFTNMQLRIKSNEELGILDSDYVEDYFGTDGFLTLRRLSNNDRVSYPVTALPAETPAIDNDVFQITVPLSSLLNEVYAVEGRVKDIVDNYTIIGAVQTPIGGEGLSSLTVEIVDGFSIQYVHRIGAYTLRPAQQVDIAERAYAPLASSGPWTKGFDAGFGL